MAIALGRGWRPGLPATVLGNLRVALRDLRPRGDRWTERRLPSAQVTAQAAALTTAFLPSRNVKSAKPPRPLPQRKQQPSLPVTGAKE